MKKNGIYARKTYFQGQSGYDVIQFWNGKNVASQFVPEDAYEDYCEAIGREPVLMNEEEER